VLLPPTCRLSRIRLSDLVGETRPTDRIITHRDGSAAHPCTEVHHEVFPRHADGCAGAVSVRKRPGPGRGGVAGPAPARERHADHARPQDLRSPDSVTPTQNTVAAAAASSDVTLPADGGLGMFLIALISFGGAVALAGAAYGLRRLSHAHAGPPMA
jgi:hypothetical protein